MIIWVFNVTDDHSHFGGNVVETCATKEIADAFAVRYVKNAHKAVQDSSQNFYFDFNKIGEKYWLDVFGEACNTYYDQYWNGGILSISVYQEILHEVLPDPVLKRL